MIDRQPSSPEGQHFNKDRNSSRPDLERFGLKLFDVSQNTPPLLVTPEGNELLQSPENEGLLRVVEHGLAEMADACREINEQSSTDKEAKEKMRAISLDLGQNRRLRFISHGSYSLVAELSLGDKDYLLKTPWYDLPNDNQDRSYLKEMQRLASAKESLEPALRELNTELPQLFFATEHAMCVEFIHGERPKAAQLLNTEIPLAASAAQHEDLIWNILDAVDDFLADQKSRDPELWRGYQPDVVDRVRGARIANFIVRDEDGTLVLVDPFHYDARSIDSEGV